MDLKPRFETSNEMYMAGIRRHHLYFEAPTDIPEQWDEFTKFLPLDAQIGAETYGIMCGDQPEFQQFEYMVAVEVRDEAQYPELNSLIVPVARYAVFTIKGDIENLRTAWQYIYQEWLPQSGYDDNEEAPAFEKYGKDFDETTNTGTFEIWIPIDKK